MRIYVKVCGTEETFKQLGTEALVSLDDVSLVSQFIALEKKYHFQDAKVYVLRFTQEEEHMIMEPFIKIAEGVTHQEHGCLCNACMHILNNLFPQTTFMHVTNEFGYARRGVPRYFVAIINV